MRQSKSVAPMVKAMNDASPKYITYWHDHHMNHHRLGITVNCVEYIIFDVPQNNTLCYKIQAWNGDRVLRQLLKSRRTADRNLSRASTPGSQGICAAKRDYIDHQLGEWIAENTAYGKAQTC